MNKSVAGRIHSVETFGAIDGPGIRYVLFLQGCPLNCLFCHNPDSWDEESGRLVTSEEIAKDIAAYRNFIRGGGVTISGGEPLLQADFAADLLLRCKEMGIHTAIDTSGAVALPLCRKAVDLADLLLLDIKAIDPVLCKQLTGKTNENALALLRYCEQQKKPVWIRHVLVPGYTLEAGQLNQLAEELKQYSCIQKIELLPFHKMGEFKWKELGREYLLYDTREPSEQEILQAKEIFRSYGLTAN